MREIVEFPYWGDPNIPINIQIHEELDLIPFYQPDDSVPNHIHSYYEVTFVTGGFSVHSFRDTTVTLVAGDCFITRPYEAHSWKYLTSFKGVTIQLSSNKIKEQKYFHLLDSLSSPAGVRPKGEYHSENAYSTAVQGIIHLEGDLFYELTDIFEKINRELKEKKRYFLPMIQNLTYNAFITITRAASDNKIRNKKNKSNAILKTKDITNQMIQHFHLHMADKPDFTFLSKELGYSEVYLRTIFKKTTGISPTKYMNKIRVSSAMNLLRETDLSIEEVAESVGIYDTNYFIRMFKSNVGHTPSRFRKLNQKKK